VFVLEDLHWSDFSTLDFISSLARRRELARLLLIGTYRPADVIITGHPLKIVRQELQLHGDCEELPLGALDPGDVAEYLATRFAGGVPEGLARMVHHRTEGHPLFMVNVVDYLVEHGGLVEADGRWVLREDVGDVVVGVPETIKQLVERQVDRLDSEEQRVLHGASVAGVEFSVAAVAAGLGADSFAVEERCEKLARQRQFLRPSGAAAMTNGTVTARYGFIHSLYQEVLYEQMSAVRRTQLHRRIGEHEEAVLGDQAADMSTELAMHFERGWDYQRAVKYLDQAAENATRRFANHEAAALARRGLELIGKWPDGLDRTRQELKLQLTLGFSLSVIKGYADPETGASMARARELSRQLGEDPQLFRVIFGLWQFYYVRADRQEARPLAEQLLRMAQQVRDPVLLMGAHFAMGNILGSLGETDLSLQHYEQAVALHDPDRRAEYHRLYRMDPGIYSRCHTVRALWVRGYPDTARRRVEEALELARHSDPRSLAFALVIAVSTYWLNREAQRVRELSEWGLEHCAKYGIAQERVWLAAGHGWALAEQGQVEVGLAEMRQSLEAIRAMHSEIAAPAILTILAEMLQKAGRIEEGLATVAEAMEVIERAGARSYKPELYRLKGELLLHCGWRMADGGLKEADIRSDRQLGIQGQEAEPDASNPQSAIRNPQSEAEACFHQAIELARQMQGKAWELRAQISLSRLWLEQGKTEEARERLAAICGQFSEGPDTADLREARALLGA
jgi:tetratricopeptide (TPR) repeat protein